MQIEEGDNFGDDYVLEENTVLISRAVVERELIAYQCYAYLGQRDFDVAVPLTHATARLQALGLGPLTRALLSPSRAEFDVGLGRAQGSGWRLFRPEAGPQAEVRAWDHIIWSPASQGLLLRFNLNEQIPLWIPTSDEISSKMPKSSTYKSAKGNFCAAWFKNVNTKEEEEEEDIYRGGPVEERTGAVPTYISLNPCNLSKRSKNLANVICQVTTARMENTVQLEDESESETWWPIPHLPSEYIHIIGVDVEDTKITTCSLSASMRALFLHTYVSQFIHYITISNTHLLKILAAGIRVSSAVRSSEFGALVVVKCLSSSRRTMSKTLHQSVHLQAQLPLRVAPRGGKIRIFPKLVGTPRMESWKLRFTQLDSELLAAHWILGLTRRILLTSISKAIFRTSTLGITTRSPTYLLEKQSPLATRVDWALESEQVHAMNVHCDFKFDALDDLELKKVFGPGLDKSFDTAYRSGTELLDDMKRAREIWLQSGPVCALFNLFSRSYVLLSGSYK
ncbi:hypothetical protein DFH09DRAFT_1294178 [Mycena vulgaris]|nr:hypothetical protein DFH09DRAFT_1294178 [Mycena vulgaris]